MLRASQRSSKKINYFPTHPVKISQDAMEDNNKQKQCPLDRKRHFKLYDFYSSQVHTIIYYQRLETIVIF